MPGRLFTKGKTTRRTIMKSSIYVPMAALFLTAALAVPAAAQKQVPFHGSLQGQEIAVFQGPPPGTLAVNGRATGVATPPRQIYSDLEPYCEPCGRYRNRLLSLHRGQWRQHLHYDFR